MPMRLLSFSLSPAENKDAGNTETGSGKQQEPKRGITAYTRFRALTTLGCVGALPGRAGWSR